MRDPTIPNADDRKKIMFYESSERQTRFRIRCDYDGITQSQFFRMMIRGYIENDEVLYEYIKSCKKKYNVQGQQKREKINTIASSAAQNKEKFALGDSEIENIFDIIEMETGL
jgi:hypothetical protein